LEVLEIRFELRVRLVFERGLEPKKKVQPCPRAGLSCAGVDPSGQTRKIEIRGQPVLGFGSRLALDFEFEMPVFLKYKRPLNGIYSVQDISFRIYISCSGARKQMMDHYGQNKNKKKK
jgi:hypothetical protein